MLNRIFKTTVYVRISPTLVSVKHVETGKIFEDKPLIAIQKKTKGNYDVKAFGASAESLSSEPDIIVKNGFNHPRVCFDNYEIAQTILHHFITEAVNRKLFLRPILFLHIVRKL